LAIIARSGTYIFVGGNAYQLRCALTIVVRSSTYIFVGGDAYQLCCTLRVVFITSCMADDARGNNTRTGVPVPGADPRCYYHVDDCSTPSFPIYDGSGDPLGWFNGCEQFFWSQRTLESDKA
jgi:hypothetical protein